MEEQNMGWFKRIKEGITTKSTEKKEMPEGKWYNCPECKTVVTADDHATNNWVCKSCGHHHKIGSEEYFHILFDDGKYRELNANMSSADPLEFVDTKKYTDRIVATQKKTGRSSQSTAHNHPKQPQRGWLPSAKDTPPN